MRFLESLRMIPPTCPDDAGRTRMLEGISSTTKSPLNLVVPFPFEVIPFTKTTEKGDQFLYQSTVDVLGKGGFGTVYTVYERGDSGFEETKLAVKSQNVDDLPHLLELRVSIRAALSLPCDVVEFKAVFSNKNVYTIMPQLQILERSYNKKIKWQSAADYVGTTPEFLIDSCMTWLAQTLRCVLSNKNAIMGDFKVDNMGFYKCDAGVQWRIIDVDGIFGDLYVSTYPLLNFDAHGSMIHTRVSEDPTLTQASIQDITPEMAMAQPSFDYYEPLGRLQTVYAIAATAVDLMKGNAENSPLNYSAVYTYSRTPEETTAFLKRRADFLLAQIPSGNENFDAIIRRALEVNSRVSSDEVGDMQVTDADGGMWKLKRFREGGKTFYRYAYNHPRRSKRRKVGNQSSVYSDRSKIK